MKGPHCVYLEGKPLATLVPHSNRFRLKRGRFHPGQKVVLSRFAIFRRSGPDMVLESPLSHSRLLLHDPRCATILFELIHPRKAAQLRSETIPPGTILQFLKLLHLAGALAEVNDRGSIREDAALVSWELHDLLFHTRSRVGRHAYPYGRTDRFNGRVASPPVLKSAMSKESVDLYKPDLDVLLRKDLPFTRVLEDRRSQRRHGRNPITLRQLGEFLFRSARVRHTFRVKGQKFTSRVYPSSGCSYELEVYAAVNRCAGIPAGLYQYDPAKHRIHRLTGRSTALKRMLKSAAATAHTTPPQLLLILSARFQRINLKYESIAYAAILKDVGILFQSFYLVATAMGLKACALGVGDSDLFAEAARLNYYAETSVGEFLLGA